MQNVTLHHFETAEALAREATRQWLDKVAAAQREGQARHHVALSGGRIARVFFQAVVETARGRAMKLEHVHFFWADERCVPPSDPESNYALAEQSLFRPLNISLDHIHRIQGEKPPGEAARLAEEDLRACVPAGATGLPVLDIAFLGMGEDGHMASLFPNGPDEAADGREVYRAVIGPKPPPQRITLSYAALAAAREVWVLISGAGKEQALAGSLADPPRTPLGKLLRRRTHSVLFTEIRRAIEGK